MLFKFVESQNFLNDGMHIRIEWLVNSYQHFGLSFRYRLLTSKSINLSVSSIFITPFGRFNVFRKKHLKKASINNNVSVNSVRLKFAIPLRPPSTLLIKGLEHGC